MTTASLPAPLEQAFSGHPLLADLDLSEAATDTATGPLGRLAASGPRADASAGLLAGGLQRRPAARLRAHRLEGAVVAVVAGWAVVGVLTLFGWL